jgi:hypothetical protein
MPIFGAWASCVGCRGRLGLPMSLGWGSLVDRRLGVCRSLEDCVSLRSTEGRSGLWYLYSVVKPNELVDARGRWL